MIAAMAAAVSANSPLRLISEEGVSGCLLGVAADVGAGDCCLDADGPEGSTGLATSATGFSKLDGAVTMTEGDGFPVGAS
jgi:hypothetical protein